MWQKEQYTNKALHVRLYVTEAFMTQKQKLRHLIQETVRGLSTGAYDDTELSVTAKMGHVGPNENDPNEECATELLFFTSALTPKQKYLQR